MKPLLSFLALGKTGFIAAALFSCTAVAVAQNGYLLSFESESAAASSLKLLSSVHTSSRGNTEARVYRLQAAGARHKVVVRNGFTRAALEGLPGVVSVNTSKRTLTPRGRRPNDPGFAEQWQLSQIDASGAWEYTTGGRSASGHEIVVGVIEFNGFELNHPQLQGFYYTNPDEVPGNGLDDDNNGLVDDVTGYNYKDDSPDFERDNHGVHVSAAMAGATNDGQQTASLNWDLKLLPYQIFTVDQWILALDQLTAIRQRFNASNGADGAYVVAVNMSLGATADCELPDFIEALELAIDAGIVPVNAVGNNSFLIDDTNDFPANCSVDGLVVVGGSVQQDELASFSNISSTFIDLAAPADIRSVDYRVTGGFINQFTGVSAAAPLVTGTVALMHSISCPEFETLTLTQPRAAALLIESYLKESADNIDRLRTFFSEGRRLNTRGAVEAIRQYGCTTEDLVVQFSDPTSAPPASLSVPSDATIAFAKTLDAELGIHLYSRSALDALAVAMDVQELPEVNAAALDLYFELRTRTPNDQGFSTQDYLTQLNAPAAWESIYGSSADPMPTDVVSAVFDQNFSLTDLDLTGRLYENTDEIPGNGLDDDANGFVDDNTGLNFETGTGTFSEGCHGAHMLSIVAANAENGRATAGLDWAGHVLPLQGDRLSAFIAAAAFVRTQRRRYNESIGSDGVLFTSLTVPQGGQLRLGSAEERQLLEDVIQSLRMEGVVTIGAWAEGELDFPSSLDVTGLLIAENDSPSGEAEDARAIGSLGRSRFSFPTEDVAADFEGTEPIRISGTSAAAAQLAGALALLYQAPCLREQDAALTAPVATADLLVETLLASRAPAQADLRAVPDLGNAAATLAALCESEPNCRILRVGPNPSLANQPLILSLGGVQNAQCPIELYDPLGRIVARYDESIGADTQRLILPSGSLAAGVYTLRVGSAKDAQLVPIVIVQP